MSTFLITRMFKYKSRNPRLEIGKPLVLQIIILSKCTFETEKIRASPIVYTGSAKNTGLLRREESAKQLAPAVFWVESEGPIHFHKL